MLSSSGTAWTIILDGVAQTLEVQSGANTGDWFGDVPAFRDHVQIGALTYTATLFYYGTISAVRVYSREMEVSEALTNFRNGRLVNASNPTGLIFNLPLTEAIGNPVDTVGALTMTRTNAAWIANMSLWIDYVERNTITSTGFAVPDNGSTWRDGSLATPYIYYVKKTVGGALRQHIVWEYGATFSVHSGNLNNVTPNFRTTSSSSSVNATLTSFIPASQPIAPPFTIGDGPGFISSIITLSGNFTGNTTGDNIKNYPGKAVVTAMAGAATPEDWLSVILATIIILGLSLIAGNFLRENFVASITTKFFINLIGYGIAYEVGVYDWWMVIFLIFLAFPIMFASRSRRTGQ